MGTDIALVANPTSGRGNGRQLAKDLRARLLAGGRDAQIYWTDGPDTAGRLAQDAVNAGAGLVAACGGDGTIQQVASALAHTNCPIGLAPAGRCNDLARVLGIAPSTEAIAQTLLHGTPRNIDLGHNGNGRYFCTVAATGFDAQVSRFVDGMRLPLRGTAAYVYGVLRVLTWYRSVPLRLSGDFGVREGSVFLAAIGNTACYGGAIRIAPDARPDDGLLDVCLIHEASRTRVVTLLPKAIGGRHGGVREVEFLRTRELTIESPTPLEIWADGECFARTPLTITAAPDALRVLVPAPVATLDKARASCAVPEPELAGVSSR